MNPEEQLKANIFEHCLGKSNPSSELLERGAFPANWVSKYVSLVEKASNIWRQRNEWPKEVVASLHFASFYLELRYDGWRKGTAQDNSATRQGLGEVRKCSEMFLLGSVLNNGELDV